MKENKASKILFILCTASLVLPWFSYSASMMGYCWGSEFYIFFIAPMVFTGYALFGKGRDLSKDILGVLGCCADLCALVWSLGTWQERHNIRKGFYFMDGIRTATVCFWITAFFHVLLFITVIASAAKKTGKGRGVTCYILTS